MGMDPYIGEIQMVAGNFAPRGWALCDGQLLAVAQYDALFSLLGTMYGGDGRTTFGLPDLRGRVAIGAGQGPGRTNRPQGQRLGWESVTLTADQWPQHTHAWEARTTPADSTVPSMLASGGKVYSNGASDTELTNTAVRPVGGSRPHQNMQPFTVVNFCIALVGVYPSRN